MRFGVLGPVAVWSADGEAVRIPERKVRLLLADLLVHAGQPVSVDRLTNDLYDVGAGDRLPADPGGALQGKISRLRQALGDTARDLVVSQPPGYALRTEAIDAKEFRSLLAQARTLAAPEARIELLDQALALWRGPAYADFADLAFVQAEAAGLEEDRLLAIEDRAEALLAVGRHQALPGELASLVNAHPLRERLQASYLLALYRIGRQSEALNGYDDLRRELADELGLDPGKALTDLHQGMLRQDPALNIPTAAPVAGGPGRQPKPGGSGPTRRRSNLPVALTELVGRADAVRQVGELVANRRLVTLIGPGGVGKTRLAIESARASGYDAWLVELAGLDRDAPPASIADAIIAALAVHDDPTRAASGSSQEVLIDALGNRELLLVLDNCEHVIGSAAVIAEQLLQATPGSRLLATSQEPLALTGESVWSVPPLDLPAGENPLASGAVGLFLARSGLGPELSPGDLEAVLEICRRLDGIPLALELAAARVRGLGLTELAARLDDRFRTLTAGHRTGPARQQTLRATIEWSWQLLTEPEQVVLRRLAIHADSFTLTSAEVIAASNQTLDVLELLPRLVDRSLVSRVDGSRFRLLASVRAYGLEQLTTAGELEETRQRHLRHYTELAEEAVPHLHSAGQLEWLERLDGDLAELCAGFDDAARRQDTRQALRLVGALVWYWFLRGRLSEADRALRAALELPSADPETQALRQRVEVWHTGLGLLRGDSSMPEKLVAECKEARDLWFLAFANRGFGDPVVTARLTDQALTGVRATADRWGIAATLALRATLERANGDLAAARRDAEEAVAIYRELGDRWGLLKSTGTLAELAEIAGDYDQARALHSDGQRLAEELGLWSEVSFKLSGLGRIALLTGDFAAAGELHTQALRLAVDEGDQVAEEFATVGLALAARRQGDLDSAEAKLRTWLDWLDRVDGEPGLALALAELGFIAELRSRPAEAFELHRQSLAAAERIGDPRAIALATEGLAGAHALTGDYAQAAVLLDQATALRESVGAPLPPAERHDVNRITARLTTTAATP
ncbi:BTAD domain-containing putative transcriptional regulator [Kribbella deserti]|uniref:BTAD domain-containing putative transcriptional regulator n=1 Tax=Kribbella deserti TaxID=1926257 RepID=A0ABV6QTI1_9ACTN